MYKIILLVALFIVNSLIYSSDFHFDSIDIVSGGRGGPSWL